MNDLLVNREHFTERERGLQDDCHRERDRTIALTEQLHAAHRDRDALQRDVASLRELVAERDAALVEERAGREKDRAALTAAMNGIDELTAQVRPWLSRLSLTSALHTVADRPETTTGKHRQQRR
jgi:hypothetical protein